MVTIQKVFTPRILSHYQVFISAMVEMFKTPVLLSAARGID
jgi:hypothetical protein